MAALSVLATSRVPPGIRGALNQWMLEVLPGIFVGRPSARVRDELWRLLTAALSEEGEAYAAWIDQAPTDQGFEVITTGQHRYTVRDHDGLALVTVRHDPREPLFDDTMGVDW